jgi:hypothetical protein
MQALANNNNSKNSARSDTPERKAYDAKIKEKNKELLVTNQNLSQQIVQM